MSTVAEALLAFVALYPVCTAALWMAGGLMFRVLEERDEVEEPEGGWPGISVLIPAYNEESVIALSVTAALASDYPLLEVLVLDDGSTDGTEAAALAAAAGDRRCRVLRDPINRGKAEQLNAGFRVGAAPTRGGHRRRYPSASGGAPAGGRPHGALTHGGGRGRLSARDQPGAAAPRHAGARGRGDHRPDPAHAVGDGAGRRRRRRPGAVPQGPRARRRRLRPAHGHGGHRADLAAAARRLADRVRAPGARGHAGPAIAAGAVGAAQALGARPGRGHPRPFRRGPPLAQPAHVDAPDGVDHLADLDHHPGRLADHCCGRREPGGRGCVRVLARVGHRDRHGRDRSADRRSVAPAWL